MKYITVLIMLLSLAVCGPSTPNPPSWSTSQISLTQTLYLPTIIQNYPVVVPTLMLTLPTGTQQATEISNQTNTPQPTDYTGPTSTPQPTAINSPTDTPQPSVSPTASMTPSISASPSPSSIPGQYTYTDGYGGDIDTGIDVNLHSTAHTYNAGQHSAIQFGSYNYALIKFNISAIPSAATVTDAKLYLGLYEGGGNADVYALLPANDGWIEGTGDFELALEDEPCWDAKQADGNGGVKTAWAGGSNGAGVPGIDITSDPIGILTANGQGIGIYAVNLDLNIVQGWIGQDNSNYGILIKPTVTNPFHIALAEYGTPEYRPKLVVEYTIP